jgi:pantetheine-phosphate adenylyltransferase
MSAEHSWKGFGSTSSLDTLESVQVKRSASEYHFHEQPQSTSGISRFLRPVSPGAREYRPAGGEAVRRVGGCGRLQSAKTLPAADRVVVIQRVLADLPNVQVTSFTGLAVQFVREQQARFMVRGIRALADTEYEFTMSLTNSSMAPEIETVFLMASKEFTHMSSTLIRQIAKYGGDLVPFLPPVIIDQLKAKK